MTIAIAGACTDSTVGQATPGGAGSTETSPPEGGGSDESSGSASPTVEIPARPQDLSLEGVDPCALLTQAQLTQLAGQMGFDEPPVPDTRETAGVSMPACLVGQSAEPFNAFQLSLVTNEGIDVWLAGDRNVDAWLVSIAGYPAVNYKLMGTEDEECVTSVGVAEGQQLTVDLPTLVDTDYRKLCEITESVATMATETLKTLR
ncbi:DUF3558 domain-containing protein [Actinophytocola gossypii]|uniref:DUF3558 domain-containing protein n=1 Tax=Actinophytocola gossypii TaxID=2812003 RepID=A0ABT2JE52_9PSEU|nr:DUF3558 domain-containing protein [Actinophytocola gossypii]MCT2586001.1 DUF3558 domain-containing protein [Actinophytocola gossypii]